ncbi:(2Fe-2S)-binding protein [Jiangella sp. DSM 45060]|uniref:(2Fe-2S)-binding protein n=1 Tax=Jiangella sp. DSM 45060 TaxID=1798224 RepID=UPI00087BEC60|nr:(2Fe-2S)-binding protein [Jiangella sp. DSM 45060]SDT18765.1 carbon-monoxide dehydrogenase small subunit [Jiangella sp. DSM 45060]
MTWIGEDDTAAVDVVVNGRPATMRVPARRTLADALRDDGLTGTHLGCEHGVCGACTVLLDGRPVRSCLTLAVQAEGAGVETVEGLADGPELHALQRAFHQNGGLQCGFCTPGFLMLALGLLRAEPQASPERIREVLTSNLCRCTGGGPIVRAVLAAQRELAGDVA